MDPPLRATVWPPLPPGVWTSPPARPLPFPLEDPAARLFARARHALWHGVRALGLRPGDRVLAPAYHQGSEIEALRRAGLACDFYDVGADLGPRPDELESLLGPRVRALYLIHYFGLPQDLARWRRWCDERGLLLLEDAAMAWLGACEGRPVGSFGDLAVFCLYKTFGLPDGGCLVSASPPPPPGGRRGLALVQTLIHHGAWLAQRYGAVGRLRALARSRGPQVSRLGPSRAGRFDLGDPDSPASALTEWLLPRVARGDAARRRRAHFSLLQRELAPGIERIAPALPAGAAPVGFPIRVPPARQGPVLEPLRRRGVAASRFWTEPHPSLPGGGFPRARALRAECLVLPVHQELGRSALEATVAALDRVAAVLGS